MQDEHRGTETRRISYGSLDFLNSVSQCLSGYFSIYNTEARRILIKKTCFINSVSQCLGGYFSI